jgi:hypothetical protein
LGGTTIFADSISEKREMRWAKWAKL